MPDNVVDFPATKTYNATRALVEELMPSFLIGELMRVISSEGKHLFRADAVDFLTKGQQAAMVRAQNREKSFTDDKIGKAAERLVRDCTSILTQINLDCHEHEMIAVCRFILKLVEEGLLADPKNPAVLLALMIMDEAQNDAESGWKYTPQVGFEASGRMLNLAQQMGYFKPTVQLTAQTS